ncbi:hydantoinase/oxoprolinase N-terminal domain-containing protein [Arthrobacter sp. B6]|uniref:hydantoinase/oxoprolinase N-terminal domain-containing protein n=1 Tax=Arthrobacter sp. B6 TaxID=1570137 RepID=UPI0008376B8E|nr:hydantoinase/oxoprolinase N-terminal domain-containing protein [Arthrobacter sp. B6]
MRVGLRLEGTSCRTVVLDGLTVVSAGQEVHAGSLPEALESSLSGLRREFGSGITEITVDVGRVLGERKLADVVAIRISPRPPADAFHMTVLPPLVEPAVTRTVHVAGGHDLRGRPLAPLDLEGFLADLPGILSRDVRNVAVTSVGSTASSDHETRIADAILGNDRDIRISISSDFYSSVFRDRDYTAILNSALMQTGEDLAVMLEAAGRRQFPAALLSFAKNDGGRAPLSRLALAPVHGLRAEPAMGILGAATLAGIPEGEVILCTEAGAMVGHIHGGLPVARSLIRQGFDASLASNAAILEPYTAHHPVRADFPSVIADLRDSKDVALPFGLVPTLSAAQDAALVGSAAAPLTAWIDRLETVSGRVDLKRVQNLAEDDAHSAAVQLGATPGQTDIIESNVYAMPYGNPGIVRIRVQAAGETFADEEHVLPTAARGATQ